MTTLPDHTHSGRDTMVTLAAAGVILALLRLSASIVEPVLLSLLIVSIASPGLKAMRRLGISTGVSVVAGLMVTILFLSTFSVLFSGALSRFVEDLPRYQELLAVHTAGIDAWFAERGIDLHKGGALHHFTPERLASLIQSVVTHLGSALSDVLLILLIVIFMLAEAAHFPRKLMTALGTSAAVGALSTVLEDVKRYATTKAVVSVVTGALIWIGLKLLGLEYAELWGALAMLLNFIPNIGSVLAAIPAILMATLHGGVFYVAGVTTLYLVVNVVIGNIVEPVFVGRRIGLSAVTVLLSLVFWGWMFGIVGMLVAVPLSMSVRAFAAAYPPTEWLAVLMGPNLEGTSVEPKPPTDNGE